MKNTEMWVVVRSIEDVKKYRQTRLQGKLATHFCAASKKDSHALEYELEKIARHAKQLPQIIQGHTIPFPYIDPVREMDFDLRLRLYFVGTDRAIRDSCRTFEQEAPNRVSHSLPDFWVGDLNAEAVNYPRRAVSLRQLQGIPAGVIDVRNSTFVTPDKALAKDVADILRTFAPV